MGSLWRDSASAIMHTVKGTWFPVACGAVPLFGTLRCVDRPGRGSAPRALLPIGTAAYAAL